MLPKLHRNKQINEIMIKQQRKYVSIEENIIAEARPIVAALANRDDFEILERLHDIMELALTMISYIVKDVFSFKNRLGIHCLNESTLSTCDIKSLYTNIRIELFLYIN